MNFKSLETRDKLRGGYYTPPALARWLVRWALAGGARRVLEPGCGDGAFLEELATHEGITVDAIELDPDEARKARARPGAARVHASDFFRWLARRPRARWDAAVGNPPYVRYQYFDAEQRALAMRLCAESGVELTKLANAWVPFVAIALARLVAGGRLAMVIPAELLHVQHAGPLRALLERACDAVTVVHLRALPFAALQGVVLLLARRGDGGATPRILELEDVSALPSPEEVDAHDAPRRAAGDRWMVGLLEDEERALLERIDREGWAPRFETIASVDVGIVTGANDYFVADDETVRAFDLERYVLPMLGRSEHVRGIRYGRADHARNVREGRKVSFVRLPPSRAELTKGALRYLARGEEFELPARYKCRTRSPWWVVPSVWVAPVALLKRCHDHPRLVLNEAGAYSTDTAYRIVPSTKVRARDLVGSFLSSLTFLSAELEGRHYGGGVLELVPSEIERLRIPLLPVSARELSALDRLVRAGASTDELLDRADARLPIARDDARLLRRAWKRLRDRRQRRAPAE